MGKTSLADIFLQREDWIKEMTQHNFRIYGLSCICAIISSPGQENLGYQNAKVMSYEYIQSYMTKEKLKWKTESQNFVQTIMKRIFSFWNWCL